MNSRTNRKFISWGNEPKKRSQKTYGIVVTGENNPPKYKAKPKMHPILQMARALGMGGRHIGSKPLNKIKKQCISAAKRMAMYKQFAEALNRAKENLEKQEVEESNIEVNETN